jgi:hypothetical protein
VGGKQREEYKGSEWRRGGDDEVRKEREKGREARKSSTEAPLDALTDNLQNRWVWTAFEMLMLGKQKETLFMIDCPAKNTYIISACFATRDLTTQDTLQK